MIIVVKINTLIHQIWTDLNACVEASIHIHPYLIYSFISPHKQLPTSKNKLSPNWNSFNFHHYIYLLELYLSVSMS